MNRFKSISTKEKLPRMQLLVDSFASKDFLRVSLISSPQDPLKLYREIPICVLVQGGPWLVLQQSRV